MKNPKLKKFLITAAGEFGGLLLRRRFWEVLGSAALAYLFFAIVVSSMAVSWAEAGRGMPSWLDSLASASRFMRLYYVHIALFFAACWLVVCLFRAWERVREKD